MSNKILYFFLTSLKGTNSREKGSLVANKVFY